MDRIGIASLSAPPACPSPCLRLLVVEEAALRSDLWKGIGVLQRGLGRGGTIVKFLQYCSVDHVPQEKSRLVFLGGVGVEDQGIVGKYQKIPKELSGGCNGMVH